jgi:hypothetical protein
MYRSRFRCNKHTTNSSSDTKTTIYTNRCNRHVIDRMLDTGKKRSDAISLSDYNHNRDSIAALQDQLIDLQTAEQGLTYHTTLFQTKNKIQKLQKLVTLFESGQHQVNWQLRTHRLYKRKDQHVARLVLSNSIMGRPTESFFSDPDRCPYCHVFYVFDSITNVHTCPNCGYTVDTLFISEDNSQDVLVTKDPNTGSSTVPKQPSDYHYIRSPLYKRYLSQFGEDVSVIPTEIMRTLYRYLSNIHLQNSIRCRPTPVGNILRTHGFAKWSSLSIRITKIFNGEPVPVIPKDTIDRLVERFDTIFREASKQKKKLPSFEFITNILLRIEGRGDLAASFALHKTRSVLRRIATELTGLIEDVRTNDTTSDLEWNNIPVF